MLNRHHGLPPIPWNDSREHPPTDSATKPAQVQADERQGRAVFTDLWGFSTIIDDDEDSKP